MRDPQSHAAGDGAPDTRERSQRAGIREKERATGEEQRDRCSLESRDTHTHAHTRGGGRQRRLISTHRPWLPGTGGLLRQLLNHQARRGASTRHPRDGWTGSLQESPEMRVYMAQEKCGSDSRCWSLGGSKFEADRPSVPFHSHAAN